MVSRQDPEAEHLLEGLHRVGERVADPVAAVRKEAGRGKDRFEVRGLCADTRCLLEASSRR